MLGLNMQHMQQAEDDTAENAVQELGECKLLHRILGELDT